MRAQGNPAVVLLDIKMPKVDGIEVLKKIKTDPVFKTIPVVILTSSNEDQDVIGCYSQGCNSYIRKPVDFDQFREAVKQLGLFWAVLNERPVGQT